MVRLEALMMGSRSVEMAAEVEKVRWRRRIGNGEEGLPNKYKGEQIIFEALVVSKSMVKEKVETKEKAGRQRKVPRL
jgi:hypothetical protein